MNTAISTFIADGFAPIIYYKQSPYLLSLGEWHIQIHSITFQNIPTVDYLIELGVHLVQPNQSLN